MTEGDAAFMKMFKRVGALTLALCCASALCLGLAALSDGVFRGYLEPWPVLAQAEEKEQTQEPTEQPQETDLPQETQQPDETEATDSEHTQSTVTPTPTPSPAPAAAPETEAVFIAQATNIPAQASDDVADLLNGIAQAAATVRPNQYLLEDTLRVEKAVIDPNALAVTPPFFDTLRRLYKSAMGMDLPAEGYAWDVDYSQGILCARLLPRDMVLRQMNGETDFMDYRIYLSAAAGGSGFAAADSYTWSASVEGFRMTANQWGEKLYSDIREMLRGICEPEERVITGMQAENGLLRYCLQGVDDPQQVDYLDYFVPGYDEESDRAIQEQAFRQFANILYRCRDYLPVRNARGERDSLINRDILLAELAQITGREMTVTTISRRSAGLGDSGACKTVRVDLAYDALPYGLKICMARAAAAQNIEEPDGQTLTDMRIDDDGTVYACISGPTDQPVTFAIGHSEWNDSLTLALELDTD